MNANQIFAGNLLSMRRQNETVEALCARAGISPSRVDRLSQGRGNLRLDAAERIAIRLNVSPGWLVFNNA